MIIIGGAAQGGFCLHGLVGELYLWSAPLSHTEVAAISVGFHPTYVTSASLVAWYPLEEGEGDRLADITRSLPDATLRGAPSWQHELPSDAGTTMFHDIVPRRLLERLPCPSHLTPEPTADAHRDVSQVGRCTVHHPPRRHRHHRRRRRRFRLHLLSSPRTLGFGDNQALFSHRTPPLA